MASLRMAPLEATAWLQGAVHQGITEQLVACWLLDGSWIRRGGGWSGSARNPRRHRHLTSFAVFDAPCDRGRERRLMNEQRNRARTAVQEVRGGPCRIPNRLSLHVLLPLLDLSKGCPLTKGISKEPRKGGPAARYRAARAGFLDRYLIGRWVAP